MNKCRAGSSDRTGNRNPNGTGNGNLWGRFGAARPSATDTAGLVTFANKPETVTAHTSQEATETSPFPPSQTTPPHTDPIPPPHIMTKSCVTQAQPYLMRHVIWDCNKPRSGTSYFTSRRKQNSSLGHLSWQHSLRICVRQK